LGRSGSVALFVGATGPPATLIRKSIAPTLPDSFSTSSESVRSATTTPWSSWMSVPKTSTPSFFNFKNTAWPMPLAAPVTSARLPFNPLSGIRRAVHVDRDAGHVGRVVGAERDDQCRGFGHGTDPPHRDLRQRTFRTPIFSTDFQHLVETATGNNPRRDAVDAHAELAELERELARECHDSGLRDRVRPARAERARRNSLARCDRGDVDDRAALLLQMRRGSAAAVEGA